MGNVHINEVQTDLEVTEGVGSLDSAEVKKLVALVLEQLKAQQHKEALRQSDDTLRNQAYESDFQA